jgi:hypothetical protein
MFLQHLHPAAWLNPRTDPPAWAARSRVLLRLHDEIAGTLTKERGASEPQWGHEPGSAYSAMGRNWANGPQREQSYSYFGIPSLISAVVENACGCEPRIS